MPLGVQIASLFADGVSLLTTKKTITDHGLSAVAGEDCAVWRGLEGSDICREAGAVEVADAGAGIPVDAGSFAEEPGDADVNAFFDDPAPQGPSEGPPEQPTAARPADTVVTAAIERPPVQKWSPPDGGAGNDPADPDRKDAQPAAAPGPRHSVVRETELPPPAAPARAAQNARKTPTPPLAAVAPDGGTFYVIASYRHLANAERLRRSRADLAARVLAGTVRGLAVYRVAVGPIAKAERRRTRARLVAAGFADVWAVKLEKPKLALELAAVLSPGRPD